MAYIVFENNNMKFFTHENPNDDSCLIQLGENSVVKQVADDFVTEGKIITLVDDVIDVQDLAPLENLGLDQLRFERDQKLKETDLWGLQDFPATSQQLAYRQALRDITETYSSIDDVVWPTKPN